MIDWNICKQDFEWEGGFFHDIYVPDTTISDWQYLFNCLRDDDRYTLKYFVDNETQSFPQIINDAFAIRQQATVSFHCTDGFLKPIICAGAK
jgi:hypothetical protein